MTDTILLTQARANMLAHLTETASLKQAVLASDGAGGSTSTVITVGGYACLRRPPNGKDAVIGARVINDTETVIVLDWNAPVTTKDHLVISGTTYEVLHVATGPITVATLCFCRKV